MIKGTELEQILTSLGYGIDFWNHNKSEINIYFKYKNYIPLESIRVYDFRHENNGIQLRIAYKNQYGGTTTIGTKKKYLQDIDIRLHQVKLDEKQLIAFMFEAEVRPDEY